MIKSNPNKGTTNNEYECKNYLESGVYDSTVPLGLILVSKKKNMCQCIEREIFEDAVSISSTTNTSSQGGFSIEDVLKLIAIKDNSASIRDII